MSAIVPLQPGGDGPAGGHAGGHEPGTAFLAVGSGEAMNEVPAGLDWPPPGVQLARTEEALTVITRLLRGETVTCRGRYFTAQGARLHDVPERRVPVYMSAMGATAVVVMNVSGADPLGTIRVYGEHVLPQLRT